jgi:nitric oxide reductase subunit B
MFNWGHHIYTLPTTHYVKHISYAVSMTELFILGNMIFRWKNTVSIARRHFHKTAYRFLIAADIWIFLNLLLAIAMSIPGINVYTHGTHITVAHTMGTTIGINSFLLLAIGYDILKDSCRPFTAYKNWLTAGYWIANLSLFVFWISLIAAGVLKAKWQMSNAQAPFSSMMLMLKPYFVVFFVSGLTMMTGFLMIIYSIIKNQVTCYIKQTKKNQGSDEYTNEGITAD